MKEKMRKGYYFKLEFFIEEYPQNGFFKRTDFTISGNIPKELQQRILKLVIKYLNKHFKP